MLHQELGSLVTAVLHAVARSAHRVAIDEEHARFDLRNARSLLRVRALRVDGEASLEREGHGGRRTIGQRIDHALSEKCPLLEDGDRAAFEEAPALVREAGHAKWMRLRIGHPALAPTKQNRSAR